MSKVYIPEEFLNSSYTYSINNNYIVVRTNNNCYQNYNTQYCDCYNIYPDYDYINSLTYACTSPGNYRLDFVSLTSEVQNRKDLLSIYLISAIVIFTFIFLFSVLCKMFFKGVFN